MTSDGNLMGVSGEGKNQQAVGFNPVAAVLYFRVKGVVQMEALYPIARVS